ISGRRGGWARVPSAQQAGPGDRPNAQGGRGHPAHDRLSDARRRARDHPFRLGPVPEVHGDAFPTGQIDLWVQAEFLHAPVGELADVEFVWIAAVYLIEVLTECLPPPP